MQSHKAKYQTLTRRVVVCVVVLFSCAGPVGAIIFPILPYLSLPMILLGLAGRLHLIKLAAGGIHVAGMTSTPYDLTQTIKRWHPIIVATIVVSIVCMMMKASLLGMATLAAGLVIYFVPTTAALVKYAWVWATETPAPTR